MPPERRSQTSHVSRARDRAADIMVQSIPIFSLSDRATEIRRELCAKHFELVELAVFTDVNGKYAGAAGIGAVLSADDGRPAYEFMRKDWPAVPHGMDQEHAVQAAVAAGVSSLPVIADDGEPLGCIPASKLLKVLGREHREDVHRLVGMLREREGARHALEDPPLRRVGLRLPWLLVGLVLSAGGAALMAGFEHALKANIALAFFIPSLVYLTDAIGTQTEAIAVRALSIHRPWPLGAILSSEVLTGSIIGIVLGILAFLGVAVVFGDVRLGLGVGLSMAFAGTLASAIGLMLPWSLSRLGIDPAFGSGPVATIIQDTLTILVYFLVMSALLPAG